MRHMTPTRTLRAASVGGGARPPESLAELDSEFEGRRSEIQAAETTRERVQVLIADPILKT